MLETATLGVNARLTNARAKQENLLGAQMTLEPSDGGDAQVATMDRRVIQLKARSTGATWSLHEVVTKVLPDLYRAVKLPHDGTSFEFVTEGRMGDWEDVYTGFRSMAGRSPGRNPRLALDDTLPIAFTSRSSGWGTRTQRAVFDHIVASVRKSAPEEEPLVLTRHRVWALLSNFSFTGELKRADLVRRIDALLHDIIDFAEGVEEKRNALVGGLLELAAKGNAIISPDGYLSKHGIDATPLSDWNTHHRKAAALFETALLNRGYDAAIDVRKGIGERLRSSWDLRKPLLAVTGESGVGKTWSLHALGMALLSEGDLPVLVEASGSAIDDLQTAANRFWQDIKGNDGTISPQRLACRWQRVDPRNRRFVILLDGVTDPVEATAIAREDLEGWGFRIAITCPPAVADALAEDHRERVQVHENSDFSPGERDAFLKLHLGPAWVSVPADVQDLLRKPVLAGVYRKIAEPDPRWHPEDEYALIQRFWDRVTAAKHKGRALDGSTLRQVALSFLNGSAYDWFFTNILQGAHVPYPWSADHLTASGLDADMIERLISTSWLQPDTIGHFRIAHDRLACFALAHGLAELEYSKRIPPDELAHVFGELLRHKPGHDQINLGYVPMDLLFLLLEQGRHETAVELIEAVDQYDYDLAEGLYDHLLPTLGERVIPALVSRLTSSTDVVRTNLLVDALRALPPAEVATTVGPLLENPSPRVVRAALRILSRCPAAKALDQLWHLHKDMQTRPDYYLGRPGPAVLLYRESFDALRAAVRLDPSWLARFIQQSDPNTEPVHDLAYLVANLDDNGETWYATKQVLFQKVAADKQRALATCISLHHDTTEQDWLAANLDGEYDLIGPSAFRGLALLNPDRALAELSKIPIDDLIFTRGWYLPRLLITRPKETTRKLHEIIAGHDSPMKAARVFGDDPNAMNTDTFSLLLAELEKAIASRIATGNHEQPPIYHTLNQLGHTHREDLLAILSRSQTLETVLVRLLATRANETKALCHDLDAKAARQLLFLINGTGWVCDNNRRLRSSDRHERLAAIEESWKRADTQTRTMLTTATRGTQKWEGHPVEQTKAAEALAVLGETTAVVEAVIQHGMKTSAYLDGLISASRPFPDAAMQPAFDTLDKPGAILAVGFGRRSDRLDDVLRLLHDAAPDSETALACLHTLGYLGDNQPSVLAALRDHLDNEKTSWTAERALLRINTQEALEVLAQHAPLDPELAITLFAFYRDTSAFNTLTQALRTLDSGNARQLLAGAITNLPDEDLKTLVQQPTVAQHLRDQALASEGRFWFSGEKVQACRALALVDPDTAYLAAEKALNDPDAHDRLSYPRAIVRIDCERAINTLINTASLDQPEALLGAIGRALAPLRPADDAIIAMLDAADQTARKNACAVAAKRQPINALHEALLGTIDDGAPAVADAAVDSLNEIHTTAELLQIAEALPNEDDRDRQWVLLDLLLRHGDPGDEGAPLLPWQRPLRELPYPLWHHARNAIERSRRDMARKTR